MTDRLDDVWTTRDRPVLIEVVRCIDQEDDGAIPSTETVAAATGLSTRDVLRAGRDLERGGLVELQEFMSGGDAAIFTGISAEALRIAGLWPDAGDAFDRLVWSLEERIAEAPPGEKGKLRKVLDAVVGVGREVGVEVLGAAITGRIPM
jgi:hypothetical protein